MPIDKENHIAFNFGALNLINGNYKVELIGNSGLG